MVFHIFFIYIKKWGKAMKPLRNNISDLLSVEGECESMKALMVELKCFFLCMYKVSQ